MPAGSAVMPLTGQLLAMLMAQLFCPVRAPAKCQGLTQISIIIFIIHHSHMVRCLPLSHVLCW